MPVLPTDDTSDTVMLVLDTSIQGLER